ncbi:hypothetical protein QUW03_04590 [Faecalicoccus acidiformans]|uniref:radical SAM protein n=1 Tax=Faecalicoccus acidiformans TaxID=915173 RepID=UPI0025A44CF1|nr:radical SAM protein [Faecalicoccus acidiformans]MDM8203646.1 hypothetical protein [Faecalicoccus acidiformans]
MEKMKRFIECYIPISSCNMRCKYCYVTQNNWWNSKKPDFSFIPKVKKAFSQDRLGGPCMVNMCATGETLLYEEVLQILRDVLSNGHYVMLVSNGTMTNRFKACCEFPETYRKHLFFKLSFHYLELKRLNKLDTFFNNVKLLKQNGISFTVELTPDDSYVPYIEEIKSVCMENLGTLCHITVCRDELKPGFPLMTSMNRNDFEKTWSQFDSDLFRFKYSIFEKKRREFCYAGLWSFVVDIESGIYKQCYKGKILGNIYDFKKPLNFCAIGNHCQEGHCFNGHAFLGFGVIPGLDKVDFADMRNRILPDGTQWLSDEMEYMMRHKLSESNELLSYKDKVVTNIRSFSIKQNIKNILGKR